LVVLQLKHRIGIFACDDYSIISNESFVLGAGPKQKIASEVIDGSLECGMEDHVLLNAEIFVRVWRKVLAIGRFRHQDWTLKVDPDTVFLPAQLRQHAASHRPGVAMYLNNCHDGLHGAIEVVSNAGMEKYEAGFGGCRKTLEPEWTTYGESTWLRRCFGLLALMRVDDRALLRDKSCKLFGDPAPCNSGEVAFHPLTSPSAYLACQTRATLERAARANSDSPQSSSAMGKPRAARRL